MKTDQVVPEGAWEFDEDVTEAFEDMLQRSIPQYSLMRDSVFRVARPFIEQGTDILDLGCSRGEMLIPFLHEFGATCHYVGVDNSEPMVEAAQDRFEGFIDSGIVSIRQMDLRHDFPTVDASAVLSVLTLQFTPIEYRLDLLSRIYDALRPGGVFVFVEKVLGGTAQIDRVMVDNYYKLKEENGYTEEDITRKRYSLEGVLVPVTADYNEDLLRRTGFQHVDCFWRWMNFAGWVAVKS